MILETLGAAIEDNSPWALTSAVDRRGAGVDVAEAKPLRLIQGAVAVWPFAKVGVGQDCEMELCFVGRVGGTSA